MSRISTFESQMESIYAVVFSDSEEDPRRKIEKLFIKILKTTPKQSIITMTTQPRANAEREPCPVCFNDDISSLVRLRGCGHSICRDCKKNLKKTNNQCVSQMLFAGRHRCWVVSVKCPMCRAIEKQPIKPFLETHISLLKKHIKDIEAKLLEKQVIEINLREQLRSTGRNPPTIPRAEGIDLVDPVRPATTSNGLDILAFFGGRGNPHNPPTPELPIHLPTRRNNPNLLPLQFCQTAGCITTKRTRSRCRTHHDVACCSRCIRCDQCR